MPTVIRLRPQLMTVHEAATVLGIGKATAYRLIEEGRLQGAVKVGRSWRVRVRDVEQVAGTPYAAWQQEVAA